VKDQTYLIYADDSGDKLSSFYAAVLVPVASWSPALRQWLAFRKWMYRQHKVPADYEWHSYQWLDGKGVPDPEDSDNPVNHSTNLRREIAEKAMKQVRLLSQLGVGIVTCETPGAVKAEAYAAMLDEVDNLLFKQSAHGVVVVDGGADGLPDPHVRAAHRKLDLRTRRVAEDGWLQPARMNQLVQAADLVAHTAYQATRKKDSRRYMWGWYPDYLHEMEWECQCP
jgi:hypothetical protein